MWLLVHSHWYHIQKWSLKCCWGCWNNSTHLYCQYSIYQDNCTEVVSSSSVFWGRVYQKTGKVWPLKIVSYFIWVQGAASWVPENQSIENCLKLVKLSCLWVLIKTFCLVSQHDATKLQVHEQRRLKLSVWTTHFLFEFYVEDITIPPTLLFKFSCLMTTFFSAYYKEQYFLKSLF